MSVSFLCQMSSKHLHLCAPRLPSQSDVRPYPFRPRTRGRRFGQNAQRPVRTLRPLQPSGDEPRLRRELRAVEHSAHPAPHLRRVRRRRGRAGIFTAVGGGGGRLGGGGRPVDLGAPPALRHLRRVGGLVAEAGADEHGRADGHALHERVLPAVRDEQRGPRRPEQVHLRHRRRAHRVLRRRHPGQRRGLGPERHDDQRGVRFRRALACPQLLEHGTVHGPAELLPRQAAAVGRAPAVLLVLARHDGAHRDVHHRPAPSGRGLDAAHQLVLLFLVRLPRLAPLRPRRVEERANVEEALAGRAVVLLVRRAHRVRQLLRRAHEVRAGVVVAAQRLGGVQSQAGHRQLGPDGFDRRGVRHHLLDRLDQSRRHAPDGLRPGRRRDRRVEVARPARRQQGDGGDAEPQRREERRLAQHRAVDHELRVARPEPVRVGGQQRRGRDAPEVQPPPRGGVAVLAPGGRHRPGDVLDASLAEHLVAVEEGGAGVLDGVPEGGGR
mmetsp:Transcript_25132/g.59763  ORF Transcript_25132/g.59763 Transcript_25132/m.59763 type:complete len:495 (-) Transcript_25132:576-2060(-)